MSDLRLPRRLPLLLFGAWLLAPLMPGVPPFWLTLANYAGIAAIIALGLVVLTGCGGMTSFAQATFMGFGAYASALLTTAAGVSPWLALPASLLASGGAALLIGAITLRLSGHYLALGTIAWAVSAYYVFGNLDLVGRNDGISGIPPLRLGAHALTASRDYFWVVWLSVALALLLTRNLLDSRPGRAIRALRGGAAAAASVIACSSSGAARTCCARVAAAAPARRPKTSRSDSELPPSRLEPCMPPEHSPTAYRPVTALSSVSASTSTPPMT